MNLTKLIPPKFRSLWHADKHFTYVVAKGGRSSGKSTIISLRLVYKMAKGKCGNVLIVRRIANTLATSVYEQIKWAIYRLGYGHEFKFTVNPLRITHISGAAFLFMGADKPENVKSMKMAIIPITDLWFEETADFRHEQDLTTIEDSIVRGWLPRGLKFTVWYSYNPPKRRSAWVNVKFSINHDDTYIHHSTYLDNPHVGAAFVARAERKKKTNHNFYAWNYLGEALGGGIQPFNNIRDTWVEPPKLGVRISQGLDFGWTDPMAHARIIYKNESVWITGEIYERKMTLDRYYDSIIANKWNDYQIRGDNEDARSITALKQKGLRIIAADKGKGSISHGLDWLDCLDNIYIHPDCTNAAREFTNAEYVLDKDGNEINELAGSHHLIDAVRYGCEPFQSRDLRRFFK